MKARKKALYTTLGVERTTCFKNLVPCSYWLLCIIIFTIGCVKSEKDYYPLAIGNNWVYTDTLIAYNDTSIWTKYVEITATIPSNGRELWLQEQKRICGTEEYVDTFFIEILVDTILRYYYTYSDTILDTLLVLPLEPNKQWGDCVVTGHEDITVPAGEFNDCAVIYDPPEYMYYAPNVGLVKSRYEGYYIIVSVLESFDLE